MRRRAVLVFRTGGASRDKQATELRRRTVLVIRTAGARWLVLSRIDTGDAVVRTGNDKKSSEQEKTLSMHVGGYDG